MGKCVNCACRERFGDYRYCMECLSTMQQELELYDDINMIIERNEFEEFSDSSSDSDSEYSDGVYT